MTSLFIRTDAGASMGFGHMMRCIALAQAWKRRGGEVCFVIRGDYPMIIERLQTEGFTRLSLEEQLQHPGTKLEESLRTLWGSSDHDRAWVVLDGYQFGLEYQRAVRECNKRLLVIDDYAHLPKYEADVLLNQNIEAERFQYQANKQCVFLLGPRYALLRREFLDAKESKQVLPIGKKVLVTVGGSDPEGVTLTILEVLTRLTQLEMDVKVVVGPANPYGEEIKSTAAKSRLKCEILESNKEMPMLMAWADLAITAGGSTCMELAYMGVPFLVLAIAENQKQVMNEFANKQMAVALGWYADLEPTALAREIDALARDRSRRESFSRLGRAFVDGLGADRVTEALDPTRITLRDVREQDSEMVWEWSNDPVTRAFSFSSNFIPWETHRRWFAEKVYSRSSIFYIGVNQKGIPIGQARIESKEEGQIVTVNLDPYFRSLGLGSKLIRMASEQAMREGDFDSLDALIKRGNEASIRAFTRAGYRLVGNKTYKGFEVTHLKYRGKDFE